MKSEWIGGVLMRVFDTRWGGGVCVWRDVEGASKWQQMTTHPLDRYVNTIR